jgi:hypothetical protein
MTCLAVKRDACEFREKGETAVEASRMNHRRERLRWKSIECVVITLV